MEGDGVVATDTLPSACNGSGMQYNPTALFFLCFCQYLVHLLKKKMFTLKTSFDCLDGQLMLADDSVDTDEHCMGTLHLSHVQKSTFSPKPMSILQKCYRLLSRDKRYVDQNPGITARLNQHFPCLPSLAAVGCL